jgi:hypothetical protein
MPTWRARFAVFHSNVKLNLMLVIGHGHGRTVSEQRGYVAVCGHGPEGHFLDSFVDGVEPVLCFVCAGHFVYQWFINGFSMFQYSILVLMSLIVLLICQQYISPDVDWYQGYIWDSVNISNGNNSNSLEVLIFIPQR